MRIALALLAVTGGLYAAEDVPQWVKEASAETIPSYPARVNHVQLLKEEVVTVDPDGHRVMRERGVIKILQRSGDSVTAYRVYDTKNGRIRDFQAWMIPPTGKPLAYGKGRILDQAVSTDDLYGEYRARVLDFGVSPPGSVLAWEIVEEAKSVFTQDHFSFQGENPVLLSRYVAILPGAWEAKGVVFNRSGIEPQVSGTSFTWELRNLAWLQREEFSPPMEARAPRLVVSYFPPTDNRAGLIGLKDWGAVSNWVSQFMDPSAEVTPAIRAKAQQLAAGASSELDKIRAIAEFVQQTKYVEISLNVARGGGYTPHRADETLSRNYGDCKDKATLMRALLQAAGIDSKIVAITSGDRHYVRPEWASPTQFNHAIVAVVVSDSVKLATVIQGSPLGNLLIFDPTDPVTPVGDLPESEQGSFALILAGARGSLLRMPLRPASDNRVESAVQATLDPDGRLEAKVDRQYFGQSSTGFRYVENMRGKDELKKRLERGWSRRLGGIALNNIATKAQPGQDRLALSLDISADHFGQLMQDRLLIIRPGLLAGSSGRFLFASKERNSPVEFQSSLDQDSIHIKIPEGFKIDEIPEPAKIESPYGVIETSWQVHPGELEMVQKLEIKETLAQASEYGSIQQFFEKVAGAQSAPVVFVRQ